MEGYGQLLPKGNNTYEWVLDDFLSLHHSARSPTFVCENVPFHLKVKIYLREDRLQLSIHTEVSSDEYFQVTFKMATGFGRGVTETRSGRMDKDCFLIRSWMPWSEMLSRRVEILRNGSLAVTIKLEKEMKAFAQANLSPELLETADNGSADKDKVEAEDSDDEESEVLPKNFKELRKALKSLFRTGENSDVTVIVGDKEFPAHKCILGMRSPALKSAFKHDMIEKQTGRLKIDDCDPETFKDFLYHIYTGSTSHVHSRNASGLYHISYKYELNKLKEVCLSCLKENLTCDSFCDTMSLALLHNEKELIRFATEFFCDCALKIMETKEWQLFLEKKPTTGNELLKYAKIQT